MKTGKMYQSKIKARIDLWDKLINMETISSGEISHVVGHMTYDDTFLLVDIKKGEVTDTTYLKVIAGQQMGWFGCDEETIQSRELWSQYFEELNPKDYI